MAGVIIRNTHRLVIAFIHLFFIPYGVLVLCTLCFEVSFVEGKKNGFLMSGGA